LLKNLNLLSPQRINHLAGPLPHLPALSPEAPHALFAPLGPHSTINVKVHGHGVSILYEVDERSRGELTCSGD